MCEALFEGVLYTILLTTRWWVTLSTHFTEEETEAIEVH